MNDQSACILLGSILFCAIALAMMLRALDRKLDKQSKAYEMYYQLKRENRLAEWNYNYNNEEFKTKFN
jgi:hypothetical protein